MLDVSVAFDRYRFLGHEFLTWIWFAMEHSPEILKDADGNIAQIAIGNRIVLENRPSNSPMESITIKGDDAGMEEGMLALKKGALVTEINLTYKSGESKWQFSVKGESLAIGQFKTPQTGRVESKEELEGAVLEKTALYEAVLSLIDNLYKTFLTTRLSMDWDKKTYPQMKKWISIG